MTKGKAFILCLIGIMVIFSAMYALVLVKSTDTAVIPVAGCLTAICTLAGLYIGGNVLNNGVKGAHWNQQMFDSENVETKQNGGKAE